MPAVSQSQQKLMGQAYALKKGELKPEDLNPEYRKQIEDLANGMTLKQLKDYAETSLKGLPKKIGEMKNIPTFESFINESTDSPGYWKDYEKDHQMQDKSGEKKETNIRNIEGIVMERIVKWNKESEDGGHFDELSIMRIKGEAFRFYTTFKYINRNIIDAMIMQLG